MEVADCQEERSKLFNQYPDGSENRVPMGTPQIPWFQTSFSLRHRAAGVVRILRVLGFDQQTDEKDHAADQDGQHPDPSTEAPDVFLGRAMSGAERKVEGGQVIKSRQVPLNEESPYQSDPGSKSQHLPGRPPCPSPPTPRLQRRLVLGTGGKAGAAAALAVGHGWEKNGKMGVSERICLYVACYDFVLGFNVSSSPLMFFQVGFWG